MFMRVLLFRCNVLIPTAHIARHKDKRFARTILCLIPRPVAFAACALAGWTNGERLQLLPPLERIMVDYSSPIAGRADFRPLHFRAASVGAVLGFVDISMLLSTRASTGWAMDDRLKCLSHKLGNWLNLNICPQLDQRFGKAGE